MPSHRTLTRRRSLRLLTAAGVADAPFGTLTGGAFVTVLALALGASPVTVGVLAALPAAASLAPLAIAPWLDRVSHRTVVLAGQGAARLLWLAPLGLLLAPPDWPRGGLLVLAAAMASLAGAVAGVAWLGWVRVLVPSRLRGRYFGARGLATGIAAVAVSAGVGPLVDGRLAGWTPGNGRGGLAIAFALAVGCGMTGVAALALVEEPQRAGPAGPVPSAGLPALASLVRSAGLSRYLAFSLLWSGAIHLGGPFIPIYLMEELHVSAGTIGQLGAVTTAATLLTSRAWGRIADRQGSRSVMLGTGVVAATLPAWWLAAGHLPLSLFAVAAHATSGIVWSGFNLAAGNLVLALVPRERNAVPLALLGAASGVGAAVGPVVGGLLVGALAARPAWHGGLGPYGVLFVLSSVLRLAAWWLLMGIEEPRPGRPRAPASAPHRVGPRLLLRRQTS